MREDDHQASLAMGACLDNFLSTTMYENDSLDMGVAASLVVVALLIEYIREVL